MNRKNKTFKYAISTFTIFTLSVLFLFPTLLYAQVFRAPTGINPPAQSSGSSGNITRDIASRSLSLGVCSGGSISDRLKEAGKGGAFDIGKVGGDFLEGKFGNLGDGITNFLGGEEWGKFATDIGSLLGTGAASVLGGPILGSVVGGLFGGGNKGPQLVDAPELQDKENCLDALANASAKEVLQSVADGTLQWVQGGDEENPLFVYDLERRLNSTADRVFGEVIGEVVGTGAFQNVCDAFKSDVVLAMQRDYYRSNTGQSYELPRGLQTAVLGNTSQRCGLERFFDNTEGDLDNFIAGEFSEGGWEAWRELSRNNPYDSTLKSRLELQNRVSSAKEEEKLQFQASGGFLPDTRCSDGIGDVTLREVGNGAYMWFNNIKDVPIHRVSNQDGTPYTGTGTPERTPCINETVVTPGSIVGDMIREVISSDIRRAELADEFNEIIANAGDLLITKVRERGLRNTDSGDISKGSNLSGMIRRLRLDINASIGIFQEANDAVSPMHNALTSNPLNSNDTFNALDLYYDGDITGPVGEDNQAPSFGGVQISPDILLTEAQSCKSAEGISDDVNDLRSIQNQVRGGGTQGAIPTLEALLEQLDLLVEDPNGTNPNEAKESTKIEDVLEIQNDYRDVINSPNYSITPIFDLEKLFTQGINAIEVIHKELDEEGCLNQPIVDIFVTTAGNPNVRAKGSTTLTKDSIFTLVWNTANVRSCSVDINTSLPELDGNVSYLELEDGSRLSGLPTSSGVRQVLANFSLANIDLTCTTRETPQRSITKSLNLSTSATQAQYDVNLIGQGSITLGINDIYTEEGYELLDESGNTLLSGSSSQTTADGNLRVEIIGMDVVESALLNDEAGIYTVTYLPQEKNGEGGWVGVTGAVARMIIIEGVDITSFTASPSEVDAGQSFDLTWSVSGADSCSASEDWSGSKSVTSGTQAISTNFSDSGTLTYTLTCSESGGDTDSETVTVEVSNSQ